MVFLEMEALTDLTPRFYSRKAWLIYFGPSGVETKVCDNILL